MSAWRIAVREIHQRGGELPAGGSLTGIEQYALQDAIEYGLIEGPGKGHTNGAYRLTPLGLAVAENRVAMVYAQRRGYVFRPTWLRALPPPNLIRLKARP